MFEVIGTNGAIALQGREQHQRSVFLSRFEVNLNLESLLILNVENQHAVTHFKRETFTLYEYAQIFGSSVEEGVKRVTPWSAHYYTHPSSYYLAEPSAAGQLVSVEIPSWRKIVQKRRSRNEIVGKTIRQVCKAAQCTTRQYHGQSWYTAFESVRNTDIA